MLTLILFTVYLDKGGSYKLTKLYEVNYITNESVIFWNKCLGNLKDHINSISYKLHKLLQNDIFL